MTTPVTERIAIQIEEETSDEEDSSEEEK